jgi:hypothetical protein
MEFSIVDELKSRIADPYLKSIDCEEGWYGLLSDLHQKLVAIDPNYTLFQVKEKFGTLRFYYEASDPLLDKSCQAIVDMYERMSARVCEKTGEPGFLMVRHGQYKTLNETFLDKGWQESSQYFNSLQAFRTINEQQ